MPHLAIPKDMPLLVAHKEARVATSWRSMILSSIWAASSAKRKVPARVVEGSPGIETLLPRKAGRSLMKMRKRMEDNGHP
jgi:hypothetical protein